MHLREALIVSIYIEMRQKNITYKPKSYSFSCTAVLKYVVLRRGPSPD